MYIWILLATIMVALSFLNTSPREDKADVFREIRAASLANRFRVEHIAFMRTLECPLIYNTSRYFNDYVFDATDESNGYTSYDENLPVGYNADESMGAIYHYLYCFRGEQDETRIEAGSPVAAGTSCTSLTNRYAISFVQIPDKWLNKNTEKLKVGDASYDVITPQASFINYLAGETSGMKNIGWVWCAAGKCHLVGRTAAHSWYDKDALKPANKVKYTEFLFPKSLMENDNFQLACMSDKPCLFSYGRFRTDDQSGHCQNLLKSKSNS